MLTELEASALSEHLYYRTLLRADENSDANGVAVLGTDGDDADPLWCADGRDQIGHSSAEVGISSDVPVHRASCVVA